jgi:type IV pilus assembly protein PilX
MNAQHPFRGQYRERGASLIVSLVLLIAVLMLGISATYIALQGERASRNERDRQIAFQAAEAALMDAELDIQNASGAQSRSDLFSKNSKMGFPGDDEGACHAGDDHFLGLCKPTAAGAVPTWVIVDFTETGSTARSVPFGKFTGQLFQTERGALPVRVPRYIIELMTYNKSGAQADIGTGGGENMLTYFYRVTAIGYGAHDTTQVVLQTFYRKED